MGRYLVVYASSRGHSGRITQRIGADLRQHGQAADVRHVCCAPADVSGYDVVVAGGSVREGRHHRDLVQWLRPHAESLNHMPTAAFGVSLYPPGAEPADETRFIDALRDETGWMPTVAAILADVLRHQEREPFTRDVMRLTLIDDQGVSRVQPLGPSAWAAVDAFAAMVSRLAGQPRD